MRHSHPKAWTGALIIGLMARYGSPAICGHGIPEAMEQILVNRSRIPLRVLFLKPLSAAISIGTGGPFGAEGPIIATGGAWLGFEPLFPMPSLTWPGPGVLLACIPLGLVVGLCAVVVTQALYAVEDGFGKLPLHWMWWPAIGAVAVGVIGYYFPLTLGVGYDNITNSLSGQMVGPALGMLGAAKLVSWTISLGSGTSGGTLAPLMTVGACLGAGLAYVTEAWFPGLGLRPELAALIGMAAIFAGSARTLFMSVLFAVETTWQFSALLPLLIGCGTAYVLSSLTMRQTIMTKKIMRCGVRVPSDFFLQEHVGAHAHRPAVSLEAGSSLGETLAWLKSGKPGSLHQGYPVVDERGQIAGVLTRKDLYLSARDSRMPLRELLGCPALVIAEQADLRQAIRIMAAANLGRLPVVDGNGTGARLIGMLTRSDILGAYRRRLVDRYHPDG